ncbi:MAG TPA: alcohol dehydrogenase catalytic domain-containing protein [Burkholderiales bacterium]|nr:alcohol dehydrogenase catalytic domain-containing protein [Burkholderiales bacterium]
MADLSRTALLERPRRFQLVDRPLPAAGVDEVVVRIAATAVCHTDLGIYTGDHPGVRYPVVMGHEATGVIEATGDEVAGLERGDPVIINPIISCGECDSCRRGAEHLCRNAGLFGREVDGSMSEYVRLASRYVYALPRALPLANATLIETLATVRHAQERLALATGEGVVVLGQGTTGLLHTRLAVLAGANPVIAVSRSRWKLELAERMGAHHVLDTGAEDAVQEVVRLTGGAGADIVIDTAGSASSLRAGIDMLRPGGRLSPYAVSHECCSEFTTFPLYYKEMSIIGSRALTHADMPPSIDLVASGQIDVSDFVSATYPLDRAPEAFQDYEARPNDVLRIVIASGELAARDAPINTTAADQSFRP